MNVLRESDFQSAPDPAMVAILIGAEQKEKEKRDAEREAAAQAEAKKRRATGGGGVASPTSRHPHTPVGSSRVDLQACKLEYSIVSPK